MIAQLELDKSRPEYREMTPEEYVEAKYSPNSASGNGAGQSEAYGAAIRASLQQ